jgi:hypothetical protein
MATKRKSPATRRVTRAAAVGSGRLTCGSGYSFKKLRGGQVALMRGKTPTAVFSCECGLKDGGCKVQISGPWATCVSDGCSASCEWIVKVPGLVGTWLWQARTV